MFSACAQPSAHVSTISPKPPSKPRRDTLLAAQLYFGGGTPAYADYAVFGCFQWARCISAFHLLLEDDPVWAWRERLLSAFDGLARKAIGYPV